MSEQEDRAAIVTGMIALGDQVQALCQASPFPMAAFVLFSQAGPIEYRSPYPKALVVEHIRKAADELEQEQ